MHQMIAQIIQSLRQIYAFVDLPYPGDHIVREIRASSVGKGQEVSISPEIEQHCVKMLHQIRNITTARSF